MKKIKNLLYQILDLLFLGKGVPRRINGFTIRFPAYWSRYFEHDYEKENVEFLRLSLKSGDTVFDVGAHLGLMSVICSKLSGSTGRVYAFEPSTDTQKILEKVIALNAGSAPILLQPLAVSDHNTPVSFYRSDQEGSNSNSLVQKHQLKREAQIVNCCTLDTFVEKNNIKKVKVLKIDAEGSELDVLKGAEQLLRQQKPIVVLAIHPRLIRNNGQDPSAVYDFIQSCQYNCIYKGRKLGANEFAGIQDFFDLHLIPN